MSEAGKSFCRIEIVGELPAKMRRDLNVGEELTFEVRTRVTSVSEDQIDATGFDVKRGEEGQRILPGERRVKLLILSANESPREALA